MSLNGLLLSNLFVRNSTRNVRDLKNTDLSLLKELLLLVVLKKWCLIVGSAIKAIYAISLIRHWEDDFQRFIGTIGMDIRQTEQNYLINSNSFNHSSVYTQKLLPSLTTNTVWNSFENSTLELQKQSIIKGTLEVRHYVHRFGNI